MNGEAPCDGPEYLFEVVDLQGRIQAPLEQNLRASVIDDFLDLLEDLLLREDVALLVAGQAVKGAEGAFHPADIGIVDDAAHDIRHLPFRTLPSPHRIGEEA